MWVFSEVFKKILSNTPFEVERTASGIYDDAVIFFNEETALGASEAAVLSSDETFVAGEEEAAFALDGEVPFVLNIDREGADFCVDE